MTVKLSAYDTVAGSSYNQDTLRMLYQSATLKLTPATALFDNEDVSRFIAVAVADQYGDASDIGSSSEHGIAKYPLPFNNKWHWNKNKDNVIQVGSNKFNSLLLDIRPLSKYNKNTGLNHIHDLETFELLRITTGLNALWCFHGTGALRSMTTLHRKIYVEWIAGAINKSFGLDPLENARVVALTLLWYETQFHQEKEINPSIWLPLIAELDSKGLGVPQDISTALFQALDGHSAPTGVVDFCKLIATRAGSKRLESFKSDILVNITMNAWFGNSSKERCAVALEHIPTWFTLLYLAADNRFYKKTILGRLMEHSSNNADKTNFLNYIRDAVGKCDPAFLSDTSISR